MTSIIQDTLRIRYALGLALILGCGDGGGTMMTCDRLCAQTGQGSADEIASAAGTTCSCGEGGVPIPAADCLQYCEGLGGAPAMEQSAGPNACLCEGVAVGQ